MTCALGGVIDCYLERAKSPDEARRRIAQIEALQRTPFHDGGVSPPLEVDVSRLVLVNWR
jgi:hypothetical protein